MDISGSMKTHVFGSDLPADLQAIQDQLDALQQTDAFTKLQNAQQTFQVDSPEVKAAAQKMADAQAVVNQWLADNNYGGSKGATARKLADLAISFGCDDLFNSYRAAANATTVNGALQQVHNACAKNSVTLTKDQTDQLKAVVAYLDDGNYRKLVAEANQAQTDYTKVLTGPAFTSAVSDLMKDPDFQKYFQLTQQREQLAGKYNIPTRLQLAQDATRTLIALSKLDETASQRTSAIGLVTFSSNGYIIQPMTNDYDLLDKQVDALKVEGETNIGEGLQAAVDELKEHADPSKQSLIVLMSDGQTNLGLTADQIAAQIPPDAQGLHARICTVGFGNKEQEVDSKLMSGLASETDGKYVFATTAQELVGFFVACRQGALGNNLTQLSGTIKGTDPVDAGSYTVADGTSQTSLTLATLNGKADVELVDPSGATVDSSYSGARVEQGDQVELVVIDSPQPGEWKVQVKGVDVPDTGMFYSLVVTAKEPAAPAATEETAAQGPEGQTGGGQAPPFDLGGIGMGELAIIGAVCCLGLLVVIGIVVAVVLMRRKKPADTPPSEPPSSAGPAA